MTTSYNSAGHKESPHKYDFEDGPELSASSGPLPARKAKPVPIWQRVFAVADAREWARTPTTDEVFTWLTDKQHVNPDYISDARFRSLVTISEQAAAKLNALYAHQLTAKIEAAMSKPNDAEVTE